MSGDVVIVERRIKAQPETVCSFFTDQERWLSWQGGRRRSTPGRAACSA